MRVSKKLAARRRSTRMRRAPGQGRAFSVASLWRMGVNFSKKGQDMKSVSHLGWIPLGAAVGFASSYVFGDLLVLPVDLYYLIYFAAVVGFLAFYVWRTGLDLRTWFSRRMLWAVGLGLVGGVVMLQHVLSHAPTETLAGPFLWWAVFWRGLAYGAVDGLLLFAFPWTVVWRAVGAERKGLAVRIGAGALAWLAILVVTTAYHLGYADFRSRKIVQPNVGSTIMAVPTLLSANPVASPVTHMFLHVGAVLHCPETELFLPPHRPDGSSRAVPPSAFRCGADGDTAA